MGNLFSDIWKDLTQPGWKQQEKAGKLNTQALQQQQATEAFQRQQAADLEQLGLGFLLGGPQTAGPLAGQSLVGALPAQQAASKGYLDFLGYSPDLAYNAERGALEKGTKEARSRALSTASRRGVLGGGNLDSLLNQISFGRTRGLSDLAGRKIGRQRESLATIAGLGESGLDRALGLYSGAKGRGFQSQVPGMLQGQARQALTSGGQPGILQKLIGAYIGGQIGGGGDFGYFGTPGSWSNPVGIGPNDVAVF